MIDPKRVELSAFAPIPHLAFSNIVVEMDKVVGTLQAVIHEMESRYRKFAAIAVRNIDGYNRSPRANDKLPYWIVIIDELADLMMAAPFEVERQICRPRPARPRHRHPPRRRHAAAVRRRHHRPHQGQLPDAHRLRRQLADRLAHHPRHGRRREAARPRRHALHGPGRREADAASRASSSPTRRSSASSTSGPASASPTSSAPSSTTSTRRRSRARAGGRLRRHAREGEGAGVRAQPHHARRSSSAASASATRARPASWICSKSRASSAPPRAAAPARSTRPKTAPPTPTTPKS